MLRLGVCCCVLLVFFSNASYAIDSSKDKLAKKFQQAQYLAEQGKISQAISIYESLIQSNPQLPEAYNNLAALYLKQKNTKKAKTILEQGIYAHKGYAALYESLTAINVAMARDAYSKALQIDLKPADVDIQALALENNRNDNYQKKKKNTIIISKTNTPQVNKTTINKPAVNKPLATKQAAVTKPAKIIRKNNQSADIQKIKNNTAVETVLQAWAAAWSAQAVDVYLSFYHDQFKPSNAMSRKGWVQSRRLKLKKPRWIKVGLSNFKVERNDGKQAVVKFKQVYRSNRYRDVSSKRVVLLYTVNGWRIFQEKSI